MQQTYSREILELRFQRLELNMSLVFGNRPKKNGQGHCQYPDAPPPHKNEQNIHVTSTVQMDGE
jgi:hypothetical protein